MRLTFPLACLFVFAIPAQAVITQVRSTPARTVVSSDAGQTLALTWQVGTDATHTSGALSAVGTFVDATTGTPLSEIRSTIGVAAGLGPYVFAETLTLTAAQLAAWRAAGVRLVGYRREFGSPGGPSLSAQFLIELRGSALESARDAPGGALAVQRMELVFSDGQRVALVNGGATLSARVSVAYSGSGTLRGRWEIAGPGDASQLFFRVLTLVREPLSGGSVATIESGPLPTQGAGRFALRFCLDNPAVLNPCVDGGAAVQTFYEVLPGDAPDLIRGITPQDRAVPASQDFRWPAVAGTTTYQLQIFEQPADPSTHPRFVTGMLLPGEIVSVVLSPLVLAKIEASRGYLWRVTGHDSDGRLIARSELANFVLSP